MLTVTLPNLKLGLWDLRDQSTLGIVDLSSYSVIPDAAHLSMQITAPGYQTVNVTFQAGNVNIYKCADLGITCGPTDCCPLPDGIYDVKYTVLPTVGLQPQAVIEKTFIKVDQIMCKFQNMFSKVDLDCNCGNDRQKQYKQTLRGVDMLIAGSVSAANDCDAALAFNLYRKADQILDNLCCEFNMSCTSNFSCPQCQ